MATHIQIQITKKEFRIGPFFQLYSSKTYNKSQKFVQKKMEKWSD
jgi:hypothetical protein